MADGQGRERAHDEIREALREDRFADAIGLIDGLPSAARESERGTSLYCLYRLERWDEGVRFFQKHRGRFEEDGRAWGILAYCAEEVGDEALHLEARQRTCELAPTGNRWVLYGVALAEAGREEEGVAAFKAAIELEPDHSEAHSNLAYWSRPKTGPWSEEVCRKKEAGFREALRLDAENYFAAEQLGLMLWSLRRYDEAGPFLRRVTDAYPDTHTSFSLVALGDMAWRRGDHDEARDWFERASKSPVAWVADRAGEYFTACRDFDIAERVYLDALREEGDHAELLWQYALMLRERGATDAALHTIRKARALAPEDVRIAEDLDSMERSE